MCIRDRGNPNINLLVIGLIMLSVLFLKEITGTSSRVYKKWPIEILEVSIYVNIVVLCISTIFTNIMENETAKAAIANTSVSITFLLFLGIICHRIFTEFIAKTNIWKKHITGNSISSQNESDSVSAEVTSTAPTSSVIDKPQQPASQLMQVITPKCYSGYELREALLEHTH